ncbi:MAG: M23 family metallopeptidase [Gemmatimonadetes bacterium]|jgi:murein DD-endopeptidase MepM/ murein hydrolase activator NlpD|nr:M23 family metallopeptidase [Gemmatimonadota bacterium]MBT6147955.1 M23 family metallopeptidase [Gemmatimonadota bacterium]MBT7862098.1 M23 family metallopeptidase [Gemmatimonadota bacterium]
MTKPARSSLVFWAFLVSLVGLTWLRIDLHQGDTPLIDAAGAQEPEMAAQMGVVVPLAMQNHGPPTPEMHTPSAPIQRVIHDTLGSDGSIYLSLKEHNISELQIARLGNALEPVFDAQRYSRPGDSFSLTLDSLDAVVRFEYTPALSPELPVLVVREGDVLVAERSRRPLTIQTRVFHVVIQDNLSNAVRAAGEGDALTDILADQIFAAVIDFHTDPREGDELELIVEKKYMDDRFIRYGEVKLARYRGRVANHTGVYYEDLSGESGYYDESGQSLARMFLLKPIDFRRISSHFNRRRFHPILKKNVPHLGTDYAANQGTVVHATARGRVTHAGYNGGYGKMVEISHANGYRTRYAHLSRIHVKKGQRVEQKDLVGRVGATGRATGPHLHYELILNGRHINPQVVNRGGRGEPLGPQSLPAFAVHRDRLLARLPSSTSTSTLHLADATDSTP